MQARTPIELADKLGLQTKATHSTDGRWTTVTFVMPPMEGSGYFEAVSKVTQWRTQLVRWTLASPDLRLFTVSARLSLLGQMRTSWRNWRSRRARAAKARTQAAYFGPAAVHRRLMATQTFAAPDKTDAPRA